MCPSSINSRIISVSPRHLERFHEGYLAVKGATLHVRFGSKADICSAIGHVCFTPNSDRKSRHPRKVMSALPPKADMCSAIRHVCFGPIADIGLRYSITSGTGGDAVSQT
jgi:hypothetical protein